MMSLLRFREGSTKVPRRFYEGSVEVLQRFREGSTKVPRRFYEGSAEEPEYVVLSGRNQFRAAQSKYIFYRTGQS